MQDRQPQFITIDPDLYDQLREVFMQLRIALVNAELEFQERLRDKETA
jgi:hypothetical protein